MTFRILLVDDNDMQLRLNGKLLSMEGYSILPAHNKHEAIQAIAKEKPDLAMLDVMMPETSGYDLCKILRQSPHNLDIPIVLLTATVSQMERELAEAAGANAVWSKPLDIGKFQERLTSLLPEIDP